jgi:hypothetical protein
MFNIGLTINFHYCGGSLKSISFLSAKSVGCGMCGSKTMSKGCCKDKSTILEVQDNQKAPASVNIASVFFKIVANCFPVFEFKLLSPTVKHVAFSNFRYPDVLHNCEVYLRNCTLII